MWSRHRDDDVELPPVRAVKIVSGGYGPEVDPRRPAGGDRRAMSVVLVPEHPPLARVGFSAATAIRGEGPRDPFGRSVGDAHGLSMSAGEKEFQGAAQSDVDRHQGDAQPVAGQHHHHVGAAAQVGEELGVAGNGTPAAFNPSFADRAGDDRRGLAERTSSAADRIYPAIATGAGPGGAPEGDLLRVERRSRRDGDPRSGLTPSPTMARTRPLPARHAAGSPGRRTTGRHQEKSPPRMVNKDGDLRADPRRVPIVMAIFGGMALPSRGGRGEAGVGAGQRRTSIEADRFEAPRRSNTPSRCAGR